MNSIDLILGDPVQEARLFNFVDECRVNEVLFYSLSRIDFQNETKRDHLKSLIRSLRVEHGVKNIGAVAEHFEFFERIVHPYNGDPGTDSLERINVYNLEFEFWSQRAIDSYYCEHYLRPVGYPCTEDGAFIFVQKALEAMARFKRDIPGIETEVYIGWIESHHADQLAGLVDRILPAVYWYPEPDGSLQLYEYTAQRNRLREIADGGKVKILPIFNGAYGTSDPSLYSWLLAGHSFCEPWDAYYAGFLAESDPVIRTNIDPVGYVWFKFTELPDVPYSLATPGPMTGPREVFVGDLVEFRIPRIDEAAYYEWRLIQKDTMITTGPDVTGIHVSFDTPGSEMLVIQAFGCGEKSVEFTWPLMVRERSSGIFGLTPQDQIDMEVSVQQGKLLVRTLGYFPQDAQLVISDLLGHSIGRYLLPAGQTEMSDLPLPDNHSIVLIRLITAGYSITKKIAIIH